MEEISKKIWYVRNMYFWTYTFLIIHTAHFPVSVKNA